MSPVAFKDFGGSGHLSQQRYEAFHLCYVASAGAAVFADINIHALRAVFAFVGAVPYKLRVDGAEYFLAFAGVDMD